MRRPGLAAAPVAVAVAAVVLPPEVRQLQAEMPQVVLLRRRKRPRGQKCGEHLDLNSFWTKLAVCLVVGWQDVKVVQACSNSFVYFLHGQLCNPKDLWV